MHCSTKIVQGAWLTLLRCLYYGSFQLERVWPSYTFLLDFWPGIFVAFSRDPHVGLSLASRMKLQ